MADEPLELPNEHSDPGALARVFLVETIGPHEARRDRDESLEAMRLMRRVVENRLASPGRNEARGATDDQDILSMGSQFAGFRDYPTLAGTLADKLQSLLDGARGGDARDRQFVGDAITVATEAHSVATFPQVTAWRTAGRGAPGKGFTSVTELQGNAFYSTIPVPPIRHRHRSPGPYEAHSPAHHR